MQSGRGSLGKRKRERERSVRKRERERKKEEGIPKILDTSILGHLYFNLHNRGEQVATREEAMIVDARGSGMVLQFIFLKFENM